MSDNSTQPSTVQSIHELAAAVAAREANRVVHTFDMPERIARLTGIKSVGLVELTAEEEMEATKEGGMSAAKTGWSLIRMSLKEVNGRKVYAHDLSQDKAWEQMGPVGRTLVTTAYGELNNPVGDETATFLKSRRTTV